MPARRGLQTPPRQSPASTPVRCTSRHAPQLCRVQVTPRLPHASPRYFTPPPSRARVIALASRLGQGRAPGTALMQFAYSSRRAPPRHLRLATRFPVPSPATCMQNPTCGDKFLQRQAQYARDRRQSRLVSEPCTREAKVRRGRGQ
ncbi:hypothetical protein L227DRAFT_658889 [Lentinus tigrinus ALCF2SS1-6]|uniref:Uncharacterized protein n=1 Tax=Lentinus tigrinus ALCF2SS1-6 TaxID=1328759 RepID=A0A5C2RNM3_9APHY|nr:hypothetical protein L227DRAFT_658889 [Lentinus tigrinus ALCF2SS1-6]